MKRVASNLFNNPKLTGGISVSVTNRALLLGVINPAHFFERGFIMERVETKQKQGHGSAPAKPKDEEQGTEKQLDKRIEETEREIAEGKKERLTTGVSVLDELIDGASCESLAIAHVCLGLSWKDNELGDKITEVLNSELEPIREGKFPPGVDLEAEILPTREWLAFYDGFVAAPKDIEQAETNVVGVEKHLTDKARAIIGTLSEADLDSIRSSFQEKPINLSALTETASDALALICRLWNKDKTTDESVDLASLASEESEPESTSQDNENQQEAKKNTYEEECTNDVRIRLSTYNALWRERMLEKLLSETKEVTGRARKLASMESKIRKIYDNLDLRTKLFMEIATQIQSVDGQSVDVGFGQDLLYDGFSDYESVTAAIKELSDDPDIAYLGNAYEMAYFITNTDR